MDRRCIVICDSGIGGLRLLKRLERAFPKEDFVYYADYKNLPYGEKTSDELVSVVQNIYDEMLKFSPKLIVFACNTASTVAISKINTYGAPVLGVYPTLGKGRGLLLCTKATSNSEFVKNLIANKPVDVLALSGLAEEIENSIKFGKDIDLKGYFTGVYKGYDFVTLGCTHYPLITEKLRKIFPKSKFLSGEDMLFEKIVFFITTFDTDKKRGKICFLGSEKKSLKIVYKNLKLL